MIYIHRELESLLLKALNTFPAVVVTGPRQSGKSTLLVKTLGHYAYVTLDDPVKRDIAISDPALFLSTLSRPVIIDEIQWAPHLLSYIKMEIDSHRDRMGQIVLTGSQHFPLIKGLRESLAGRIAVLELLPFSLHETTSFSGPLDGLELFIRAALRGSFPELVVKEEIDPTLWFGSYVQTYLERDVRTLGNVGNLRDFQRFLRLLATRCSQVLNLSSIANDLGVAVSTIKNWLSVLEAGRIIHLLSPYYSNLGKRVIKSPKIYFLDVGLVCYLTGIKDREHLIRGPMAGALFENYCIQETLKRILHSGRRPNIYYMRTSNGLEVDLLIEESFQQLVAVEIKLSKTPSLSLSMNLIKFRKLFDEFTIKRSILLSATDESHTLGDDIRALTVKDFLNEI